MIDWVVGKSEWNHWAETRIGRLNPVKLWKLNLSY